MAFFIRHNEGILDIEFFQHFEYLACFKPFQWKIFQKNQFPFLTFQAESRSEGCMLHLFGNGKRVIPGHGAEDRPSSSPEGGSPGSCSSPSGSFLSPRLFPSSPNIDTSLFRC